MIDLGVFIPLSAIILGIGLGFFGTWTSHKQKLIKLRLESEARNASTFEARYAGRVEELEDRVRILERIVTDKGYDIAAQIEALRDTAPPAAMAEKERA